MRIGGKARDVVGHGRLHVSNQVVWNPTLFGSRGLVCQTLESPVDLHGIGRDDLAIDRLCQCDGNGRLAGGGWPEDRHHGVRHGYTVTALTTWPRSV